MQKLPVMHIKPLLTLPINRNKIIHYVLGKSVVSFFNFLPLFAIIPFSIILIANDYSTSMVITWMLTMFIFTLIINFLNFIIESKSAETELSFLPIILIVAGLFALNYFDIISFSTLLSNAMNNITANLILIVVPLIILGTSYYLNFFTLKKKYM